MLKRWMGWIACKLGLHRWWRVDGFDFGGLMSPQSNEEMRCACARPGCDAVHLGQEDRADVVRAKFEVLEGGGEATPGALSMADLRVLPPPCAELDRLFDEIVAGIPPSR